MIRMLTQENRLTFPSFLHYPLLLGIWVVMIFLPGCQEASKKQTVSSGNLFEYNDQVEPRWSSSENLNGAKAAGGKENNGAKGHPYDSIPAGQSLALLDIQGQGIINRMW